MHQLTLLQLFSMGFDRKFKINLHHERFPEAFEKYTRFPKFTLLSTIGYVCINRKLYAAKFASALYGV